VPEARTLLIGVMLLAAVTAAGQAPPSTRGEAPAVVPAASAPPSPPVYRSSLFELIEHVAAALESLAAREGVRGPVSLETVTGRGLDARRADRVFTARLRRRLRQGARLTPVATAPLRARVVLSLEGSRLWAVGVLEGGALPGPSSFAVSRAMDRELETLFGKVTGAGRTRWVLERLGPVPSGVLDVALHDINDDLVDDVVLLTAEGLRAFRYTPGAARPEPLGKLVPFPGSRRWPRTVLGWVAADRTGALWASTSAGHRLVYDPDKRQFAKAPKEGVPLRQMLADAADEGPPVVLARGWYGSPTLSAPFIEPATGQRVGPSELPPFVRDLVRWPGKPLWLWIDEAGRVGATGADGKPRRIKNVDRAGDRLALADLDGDGVAELVTSAASAPGDADQLTLYRMETELQGASVAYRTPLSGGEIVGLALGDLDFDDRLDLIVVEEAGGEEAILWRLEYAP
jgi:hypothetical protein